MYRKILKTNTTKVQEITEGTYNTVVNYKNNIRTFCITLFIIFLLVFIFFLEKSYNIERRRGRYSIQTGLFLLFFEDRTTHNITGMGTHLCFDLKQQQRKGGGNGSSRNRGTVSTRWRRCTVSIRC